MRSNCRTRSFVFGSFVAMLALTACASDDARVAELEASLAEAEQQVDELRAANERLTAELEELRDDEPVDEPTDEPTDDETSPTGPTGAEPQQVRTPEALTDQLRLLFGRGDLPEEFEPGSTDWQPFDLPDEVASETYDEIGLVGVDLVSVLDGSSLGLDVWESTVRALPGDDPGRAHVAVLSWGFADDSVQGRDVLVTVTLGDDGWQPVDAEVRYHCWRGVTENLCV